MHQLFSRWSRGLIAAVLLSLFALTAALFVGCDKESPVSGDDQVGTAEKLDEQTESRSDANVQMISLATAKYSYRGILYNKEELQKMFKNSQPHIMFIGVGLPEGNVVYVFDSEADFRVWAKNVQLANKFPEYPQAREHGENKSLTKSAGEQTIAPSGGGATLYNATYTGTNRYYPAPRSFAFLGDFSYKTSSVQVHCANANSPVNCTLQDDYGNSILIYNPKVAFSYGVDLHGHILNNTFTWAAVYYGGL